MEKKIMIDGMKCNNCVKHVKEALMNVKGISGVEVNLEENCAFVRLDSSVSDDILVVAIDEAGYDVIRID